MKFPELVEVEGKLADRQTKLADIFAQAQSGSDGTIDLSLVKGVDNPAAEIKALNDELTELGAKRDQLKAVADASRHLDARTPGDSRPADAGRPATVKSAVQAMLKSDAVVRKGSNVEIPNVDVKALFSRAAGWDPEVIRSDQVVLSAQRPVQVTDLMPSITWGQKAYSYMEETTFTSGAAERAEGAAYGEAALQLTERLIPVETVGVFIPVTDEQLEDEAAAEEYLMARLPFMVRQRADGQLLVGDGTTPNLRGVNNVVGIQTQAKGADPTPDAVYKAMTKVKVTGRATPSAAIFHPNDWQDVRLLRTTEGVYIWGSPSEPGPARIWGLQVVESDAQTENTAVVGDFANYSMLVVRRGMEVKVSDSHDGYFVEGKQAIRAGIRIAAVWLRPAAFATVTGI